MINKPRSLYSSGFKLFGRNLIDTMQSEITGECELFPQCMEVYGRNCAQCSPKYVVIDGSPNDDGSPSKVCSPVSNLVDFCSEYENDGLCKQCEPGYFLHDDVKNLKLVPENGKQCLEWSKKILKCNIHFKDPKNNIKCQECVPGYMLSQKMDKCEEHHDEKCLIASNIGCDVCASGHSLQNEPLNYIPAHLNDYHFGTNVLQALLDNKKRTDLIQCREEIQFCRKYITINAFSKNNIKDLNHNALNIIINSDDHDHDHDNNGTEAERVLSLISNQNRKLFEVKFGDDEQNKWIFGISNDSDKKKFDNGMNDLMDDQKNPVDAEESIEQHLSENILENEDLKIVTCGRCAEGYFLFQTEPLHFECMEANIISNCEVYKDRNNCFVCEKNFFLYEGKCVQIDKDNYVDHCIYYNDQQECLSCESEFALFKVNQVQQLSSKVASKFQQYTSNRMRNITNENSDDTEIDLNEKEEKENIQLGGMNYQMMDQLNITQIMTKEILHEYINGETTMQDINQSNNATPSVNYDLSSLNVNDSQEPMDTTIYENEDEMSANSKDKQIRERVKEIENLKDGSVEINHEQDIVDGQIVEKQVIRDNSEKSHDHDEDVNTLQDPQDSNNQSIQDQNNINEGAHINDESLDGLKSQKNLSDLSGAKEEDIVVLGKDPSTKSSSFNRRARKLLDLFGIFSKKHPKKKSFPKHQGRKLTTESKWSLRLSRNLKNGRILEDDDSTNKSDNNESDDNESGDNTNDATAVSNNNTDDVTATSNATDASNENATDASNNDATDASNENATDTSNNDATDASKENATDASNNNATDASKENATDASNNDATDASNENATDASNNNADDVTDASNDNNHTASNATDTSNNDATDASNDNNHTASNATDTSNENATDASNNDATDASNENATDVSNNNADDATAASNNNDDTAVFIDNEEVDQDDDTAASSDNEKDHSSASNADDHTAVFSEKEEVEHDDHSAVSEDESSIKYSSETGLPLPKPPKFEHSEPSESPSHKSPSHESPSHESPSHKSLSHKSPSHKSPSHESPSHESPSHESSSHESSSHVSDQVTHHSDISDSHHTEEISEVSSSSQDNLKKFHDSTHIIMETKDDLEKEQLQKDKQMLDSLFDDDTGEGYDDIDAVKAKKKKLEIIHKIINQMGVFPDHEQIISEEKPLTVDEIIQQSQPSQSQTKAETKITKTTKTRDTFKPQKSMCMILNSIPNCSVHYRGNCIECDKGFYLIHNVCKSMPEEKIQHACKAYNKNQECTKCENNYILVSNKCLMFKKVTNCAKQVYYPNGQCLVCQNGYIFNKKEKKCVSREMMYFEKQKNELVKEESNLNKAVDDEEIVDEESIDFDKNCLLERSNVDKTCFMCRTGYFMNKKGECIFGDNRYSKSFWKLF